MIYGSSSYYSSQMKKFSAQVDEKTKEKKIYDKVLLIVQSLVSGLPSIRGSIEGAMKDCASGGFSSGDEPYGQGRFEECISQIDEASSLLESAIATITSKITALEAAIEHFQKKYDTAKTNYIIALAREQELAKQENEK